MAQVVTFECGQNLSVDVGARRCLVAITEGWAARCVLLSGQHRQITSFFIQGELCDPSWLGAPACDPVVALTRVQGIAIPADTITRQMAEKPPLRRKIMAELSARSVAAARWTASIGRVSALERLAFLLCDLVDRLGHRPGRRPLRLHLPLTEPELADATGLTMSHVRRVLGDMRAAELALFARRTLTIPDLARLQQTAGFVAQPAREVHNWAAEFAVLAPA